MNKLLKKYIDTNRFGNSLHRLTTFMFFRNYDWDDFLKKPDNIYYAFKKLPSNSFIELLEKAPHAEIKSFLERNTLIYKKIIIDLLNENNIAVAKYLQSKANYPYLQMKDIPDFNSQEANEEPLALAIMTKNKNFYEILASPFYYNDGKDSEQKKKEILFYFIERMDVEGVRFTLDNNIGKYYQAPKWLSDKTESIVLSEAFKDTNKEFYEKNKEKINDIIILLYEDFTKRGTVYSTYASRNEIIRSKADHEQEILINDISDNVYPEITGDILHHFSSINKMEINFEIESLRNKYYSVDNKAYEGYGLFEEGESSGKEVIWAMLKMDKYGNLHSEDIKKNFVMLHMMEELEKIKIKSNIHFSYVNKKDLNDFINERIHLIEKFKDTSVILNEKITIKKESNEFITVTLNHPTLSVAANNKKYFDYTFQSSIRDCMNKLSVIDVYNSGSYDLLKSIQDEYSQNTHPRLNIGKGYQLRYFKSSEYGVTNLFEIADDTDHLKEEYTKNYIRFMIENWDTDLLKQFKISEFIKSNNLSVDFIEETVKQVLTEKLKTISGRRLNGATFSKKMDEFKQHFGQECAIISKKILSDSVEIGKIKKANTVRL